MTETNHGLPTRIGLGAYGLGAFIIKGIGKMLGIMAVQMFIMLAISTPFVILFGIGAFLTGSGLQVAVLGVPVGILFMFLLVIKGIGDMENGVSRPPASSTSRHGNTRKKDDVLDEIREGGMGALLNANEDFQMKLSVPTTRDIADALEEAGCTIHYNGSYTGPGPSTTQMYERAGLGDVESYSVSDYEPRENRVSFRYNNGTPGPSTSRLSLRIEEHQCTEDLDGTLFEISCNRSAGTPDEVMYAEVPDENERYNEWAEKHGDEQ